MENSKIICQLCKREFESLFALKMHFTRSHKTISSEEYYDNYLIKEDESSICICGNKKIFINISLGYNKTCCQQKCMTVTARVTIKDKYGVDFPGQIESGKILSRKTRKRKYGNDWGNNPEQAALTSLDKYGETSFTKTKEYRDKTEKKAQDNYGVSHHLKAPEVIQTRMDTVRKEYGVDNVFQAESVKVTIKETWEENYPEGNPNRNKKIRDKIEDTTFKNHGVRHYLSLRPNKEKNQRTRLNSTLKIILNRLSSKYEPLFASNEYEGSSFIYKWKCKRCSNEFEDFIQGNHPRCDSCYPAKFGGSSIGEKEVAYFLENYTPILTNKKFKKENSDKKFEIDILLPDKNIGIEYNGIRYHAEVFGGKDKDFHLNKTNECIKQNIQLIHIFEHEWLHKSDIIKSILLSKISLNQNILYARKCIIKEVKSKESNQFLEYNHIQGNVSGSIRLGLYYENTLVSLMTFSKSRFNKNYEYELLRFCNLLNTTIIGGFAKLLKYFKNHYKGALISYADRRFSNGDIYEKNNFNLIHISPPSYYYISPKGIIYNRVNFQKHKLKSILPIFDEKLSEWENMQLNGYDRFWDCGSLVYELK